MLSRSGSLASKKLAAAMKAEGMSGRAVENAERGMYTDFDSELNFPKMELVALLERHCVDSLAKRVMRGEFDG